MKTHIGAKNSCVHNKRLFQIVKRPRDREKGCSMVFWSSMQRKFKVLYIPGVSYTARRRDLWNVLLADEELEIRVDLKRMNVRFLRVSLR